jgi:hypothetical protein
VAASGPSKSRGWSAASSGRQSQQRKQPHATPCVECSPPARSARDSPAAGHIRAPPTSLRLGAAFGASEAKAVETPRIVVALDAVLDRFALCIRQVDDGHVVIAGDFSTGLPSISTNCCREFLGPIARGGEGDQRSGGDEFATVPALPHRLVPASPRAPPAPRPPKTPRQGTRLLLVVALGPQRNRPGGRDPNRDRNSEVTEGEQPSAGAVGCSVTDEIAVGSVALGPPGGERRVAQHQVDEGNGHQPNNDPEKRLHDPGLRYDVTPASGSSRHRWHQRLPGWQTFPGGA